MNILLIVVGSIFIISAIVGYRKGFIAIVASLAATILTIALVIVLTPIVSKFLLKTFPIERAVQEKCLEIIKPDGENVSEGAIDVVDASKEAQIAVIENSELPDALQQLLLANNNSEIYESLGVNTFSDYVGSYLASLIANIISFIVLVTAISIFIRLAVRALRLLDKLPLVGTLNRLAGAGLGLANGLLIVWIIFLLVTLLYSTEIGRMCYQSIMKNPFLKMIYNHNVLMDYVTKIIG